MSEARGRMISVRLLDGPMEGRLMDVPAGTEAIRLGTRKPFANFWTYLYAGKDGAQTVFALRQKSRVVRRAVRRIIERSGKHPALEYSFMKRKPILGRTDRRGQGARRRAAKRATMEVGA